MILNDRRSYQESIAISVGLESAIIYEYICAEVNFQIMNHENDFDGFHWVKIEPKHLSKFFPYISETKMKRALKNLEKANLIKIMGCYCVCLQEKDD